MLLPPESVSEKKNRLKKNKKFSRRFKKQYTDHKKNPTWHHFYGTIIVMKVLSTRRDLVVLTSLHLENLFPNPKKISQFAVGASIVAHLLAIIILKNMNFVTVVPALPPIENYVDLGYQEFEEVPQIVEVNTPVIKDNVDTVPDKAEPAPVAQEMQDQSSDVAGLQKEVTKETPKAIHTTANVATSPYYKVKPKYPKDALLSGVEGNVRLQIDIKEDGSVENIKVLGGEKVNVFEAEARRAVTKYKYKPFVDESGQPIKKQSVVLVNFTIQDAQSTN